MSSLFDLTGKVAIITGSTKGIGKAIAEEYAKAGAKVVISSRKADVCEQVANELREQGFDAMPIACHVGDKAQLQNLVDQTLAAWGKIDILVCNAATNPVYGPTHKVSDEAFDKIMGTNVKGTFWLARNLSLEWGPQNIRVNSIAPGLIRTDFAQALIEDPDRLKRVEEQLPLRRVGEPVDIAGVALFLGSRAGAYVTGQTIVADGGDTIT